MGEFAAYIWSAYGAAAIILVALAVFSWLGQRKARADADRLSAQSTRRERPPSGENRS